MTFRYHLPTQTLARCICLPMLVLILTVIKTHGQVDTDRWRWTGISHVQQGQFLDALPINHFLQLSDGSSIGFYDDLRGSIQFHIPDTSYTHSNQGEFMCKISPDGQMLLSNRIEEDYRTFQFVLLDSQTVISFKYMPSADTNHFFALVYNDQLVKTDSFYLMSTVNEFRSSGIYFDYEKRSNGIDFAFELSSSTKPNSPKGRFTLIGSINADTRTISLRPLPSPVSYSVGKPFVARDSHLVYSIHMWDTEEHGRLITKYNELTGSSDTVFFNSYFDIDDVICEQGRLVLIGDVETPFSWQKTFDKTEFYQKMIVVIDSNFQLIEHRLLELASGGENEAQFKRQSGDALIEQTYSIDAKGLTIVGFLVADLSGQFLEDEFVMFQTPKITLKGTPKLSRGINGTLLEIRLQDDSFRINFPSTHHFHQKTYASPAPGRGTHLVFKIDNPLVPGTATPSCTHFKVNYQLPYYIKKVEFKLPDGKVLPHPLELKKPAYQGEKVVAFYETTSGQSHADTFVVEYIDRPQAALALDTSALCQYVPTILKATYQADTVHPVVGESWVWEFWKNDTVWLSSTEKNPQLTFTQPGIYTVKLRYSNGFCDTWIVKDSALTVLKARKPGFEFDRKRACAPAQIGLQNRSQGIPAFLRYESPNAKINKHTATADSAGWLTVIQVLKAQNGCITSDTQQLWIKPGWNGTEEIYPSRIIANSQNHVQVYWNNDYSHKVQILKETDPDRTIEGIDNWTDFASRADSAIYTYQFLALDSCDKGSRTVSFTNLLLEYDDAEQRLTWNPLPGFKGEYEIQILLDSIWQTLVTSKTNQFTPEKMEGWVRVVANDTDHNTVFESNAVRLDFQQIVPNAFTPNGDGINDIYLLKGFESDGFEMTIYSRWGQRVAHSTHPDWIWDGNLLGQSCPVGMYYYVLKTQKETRSGTLSLIR